jgi:Trk K+ transport system NAD-binding subunit
MAGLTPIDAISYAVTLLTGASGGTVDIDPATASTALKIYGIGLSLLGAALVGVIYALITDAIIGSRLLRLLGRRPIPRAIRDHVIVCGLGSIGYRVALGLVERKVRVVAVEANENGRFVGAARSLAIPVVTGDARQPEILGQLGIRTARALIAATDNDLVNLAAALNARAVRPDLRVVVRLFDPDFAVRVQRGLKLRFTRSVSHLAAPAFAAAVYGTDLAASIPVGDRRVVLFARVRVAEGSRLVGETIGDVAQTGAVQVLAARIDGDPGSPVRWRPDPASTIAPGTELYVAATRAGLAILLERAGSASHGEATPAAVESLATPAAST